jgi:hypothetical protein
MRLPLAIVLVLLVGVPISADVLIVEKTVFKAGDRPVEGVRSTFIKDTRMRVELAQNGRTAVTVYDLPAGEMLELDAAKRRAYVRTVTARNAKLEKEYPRERTTVAVIAAGSTRTVAGFSCDDHTFKIRVPMTKSGEIVLVLTGSACLAAEAPSAVDYMTFAKAATEQNLVLGQASDNYILLAITRGQTELYRALAMTSGVPLIVDLTVGVDGRGMLAGIVRKAASSSRVTTVAKIESAAIDDAKFAVPAAWKREKK